MKNRTFLLHALSAVVALAPVSALAQTAQTYSLIDNTNPDEVLLGNNDGITHIGVGQTLYVGINYDGGGIGTSQAIDYFTIAAMLFAVGGDSSVSFNFYTGIDTASPAGITGLTTFGGMSAGMAFVPEAASDDPSDPGTIANLPVTAQLEFANAAGDPFTAAAGQVFFIGITNTGANDLAYYRGSEDGIPNPTYAFAAPFRTSDGFLRQPSYIYNPDGSIASEFFNTNPYLDVTFTTVPEPTAIVLGSLGGLLLLGRRSRRA